MPLPRSIDDFFVPSNMFFISSRYLPAIFSRMFSHKKSTFSSCPRTTPLISGVRPSAETIPSIKSPVIRATAPISVSVNSFDLQSKKTLSAVSKEKIRRLSSREAKASCLIGFLPSPASFAPSFECILIQSARDGLATKYLYEVGDTSFMIFIFSSGELAGTVSATSL